MGLPVSVRFAVVPRLTAASVPSKLLLLDVMDTLVADPFFRGFHKDLFGLGSIEELFAIKDQQSFAAFERGELSEAEHFATYFTDRRPVDGRLIQDYLCSRYEELPGAGVPMAAMSNYPAPWAAWVEHAVGLSQLVPWAFVSGDVGLRKPSPEAYLAALKAVGRRPDEVVFVDDNKANCDAAQALGIDAIHFEDAAALRTELQRVGMLP